MDLVIARDEGIISIDNQPLAVDTSPLATNISLVAYDCTAGAGNLEYNDRLRLLEPFIDVTPYTALVNAWITQASMLSVAITLAQAKAVKIGLVDGLFNSKRQLPVIYAGNTWDATDQAVVGMQSAIMSWDVAAAITQGDAQFSNNVNAMQVHTPVTAGVAASVIAPITDSIATIFLVNINGQHDTIAEGGWTSAGPYMTGVSGGDVTQQPNVSMSKDTINAPSTIIGPPIDWPPLNSTLMVRLTMAQMRELIWGIQWRRTQLQTTRLLKTQIINSFTTLAAVIAYDVTSGWTTTASPPPPTGTETGGGVITGGGGNGGGGPTFTTRADATSGLLADSTGWGGFTIATAINQSQINPLDGGKGIRVTLVGHFSFGRCFVGPRAASHPNGFEMASTNQLMFGGRANGNVSGALLSDVLNVNIDGTNGIVVRVYITSANPQSGSKSGWQSYYEYASGDLSGILGASGWAVFAPNTFLAVSKLESSY